MRTAIHPSSEGSRFRASASRSDLFDARGLATFLRTDHHHLSPRRPSSEPAQELKGLTRDYARQVRQQTRLLNQLTAALKTYYPRALEVSEDLKHEWVRAFLHDDPTPAALAALTERQWLRWARGRRLSAERLAAVWEVLRAPQLPVPPHVVRVRARLVGAVLEPLDVTIRTGQAYREAITDFSAGMPAATWATSLLIMRSAPSPPSGSKSCSCSGPGKSRTTRRLTWRPWPDSTSARPPDRKCVTSPWEVPTRSGRPGGAVTPVNPPDS